jgi:hypothetical protein
MLSRPVINFTRADPSSGSPAARSGNKHNGPGRPAACAAVVPTCCGFVPGTNYFSYAAGRSWAARTRETSSFSDRSNR